MNKLKRWKFLMAPFLALLMVFGVYGSVLAAQPTGAASFIATVAPDSTVVGGPNVNISIQVLDETGAVNLESNGQADDVLFSVTSSLGTLLIPGNVGASDQGTLGQFATVSGVNYAPIAGDKLLNVFYGGTAGIDTITVRMYESVSDMIGFTVSGAQIGTAQTLNVTVGEGEGITRILNVVCTNDVDAINDQLFDADDLLADGDAIYADQDETVAGRVTAFQVTTRAGESGAVTLTFKGINQPDRHGNNAKGEEVTTTVNVVNGIGTRTATFTKAGYYEIRGSAGSVTYTKLAGGLAPTDIVGDRYALRVRPKAAIKLSLFVNMTVLTDDSPPTTFWNNDALYMVERIDGYGNKSGWLDPTIASWWAPGARAAAININVNASGTANANFWPLVMGLGASAVTSGPGDIWACWIPFGGGNNISCVAGAPGLTDSDPVSLIVAADFAASGGPIAGEIISGQIDDGTGIFPLPPGAVQFGVGQQLNVIRISAGTDANDGAGRLAAGQPVLLKLVNARGKTQVLTSSLVAAGTMLFADTDGDWVSDDKFTASFTLPTSTFTARGFPGGPGPAILEIGNGKFGSYVLSRWAGNADYDPVRVIAAVDKTLQLVNPNGFEVTGFNARFRGTSFNIPNTGNNASFKVIDQYGNNVPFVVSGLTATLTNPNVIGGNNSVIDIGRDIGFLGTPDALMTWGPAFAGDDTITVTPISVLGIPAITIEIKNIGTNDVQTIAVTPMLTETLANSITSVVIETTDLTGVRGSGGQLDNLIVTLESTETVARLVGANGVTTIPTGTIIDTNNNPWFGYIPPWGIGDAFDGRLCIGLDSGSTPGTLTIKVQTLDGSVVGETPEITVAANLLVPLAVDPESVTVAPDATINVTVTGGTSPYTVASSDETIATATVSANTVTITGVSEDVCTVTVTDSSTPAQTAEIAVTVSTVVPEPIDPPTEQYVGSCNATCQATAPMTVAGGLMDVNFNYTAPVEVMGGVMSVDFSTVWWLTDSCTFSTDFEQAATSSMLFSCTDEIMPAGSEQGWIFWLVAPSDTADFGSDEWWDIGVYELMWYQLP